MSYARLQTQSASIAAASPGRQFMLFAIKGRPVEVEPGLTFQILKLAGSPGITARQRHTGPTI